MWNRNYISFRGTDDNPDFLKVVSVLFYNNRYD